METDARPMRLELRHVSWLEREKVVAIPPGSLRLTGAEPEPEAESVLYSAQDGCCWENGRCGSTYALR